VSHNPVRLDQLEVVHHQETGKVYIKYPGTRICSLALVDDSTGHLVEFLISKLDQMKSCRGEINSLLSMLKHVKDEKISGTLFKLILKLEDI